MASARSFANLVNRSLKPLGVRIERLPRTSWDVQFARWAEQAKKSGTDPNDIGDDEWGSDLLDEGLAKHYLPFVNDESIVLELGPGSGRLSRHLIGHCAKLIVADSSVPVIAWIDEYLRGKGTYEVHRIRGAAFPDVADQSVDCVFAHGVFEHLDFDECYWFFTDFFRVLKPGGTVAFNYDSLLSDDASATLAKYGSPTQRSLFRLHHPAAVEHLARMAGFSRVDDFPGDTRIAFARFQR